MAGQGARDISSSQQAGFSVGNVVGAHVSPLEAFSDAIGYKVDPSRRDERSRRTRESRISNQESVRGPRPAVIVETMTDPSSGKESFLVNLFASFSSTPLDRLYENTKDLTIPVANPRSKFPDSVQCIRTDPPWPKDIQYVITRSVWTSDIEEWRCRSGQRYRVSQEDCGLLNAIGAQQGRRLRVKLRTYPRNGVGWLEDIKQAIAVVYTKESNSDESAKVCTFERKQNYDNNTMMQPKIYSKRAFSVRTFMSSRSKAPTVTPIMEDQSNDSEDGSWSIVSTKATQGEE
ncbi:hypothetical protein VKT23_004750 [Stygiomarasmius scandens]|uniref:Uncharacterized protein n=1 Tax=Marasmiellus scandens TaxID=2682957 RepID=A0ABR1JWJ2_9AGAR